MVNFSSSIAEFRQVFAYRDLIKNLVARDLKVRYKRSILGFVWVMLNPLLMMIVIYMVFSQIFKGVPNYAAYIISGIILWSMFSHSTSTATNAFLANGGLLKKIAVPKIIFPISSVISGLINFCFSLVPLFIIFTLTGTPLKSSGLLLPLCIAEVLVFSMGIALILSTVVVFFHDVVYIYEFLLLAWMYFSPIFYPVSILPDSIAKWMQFNPVFHYLSLFRGLIYDAGIDRAVLENHFFYGLFFALLSLTVGVGIYLANRHKIVLYL
jgi:ABC-type polysaccharide/polyol phosphate export permease